MKNLILLLLTAVAINAQIIVYDNNFESGGVGTSTNPTTGHFLGKFSGASTQIANLALTNLPPHQFITVAFDLIIARTWDGNGRGYIDTNNLANYIPDSGPDIFKVTADGRTMVHTTFASHDLEFYRYQSFPGTYPQDAYRPGTGAVCTNCCGAQWDLNWYWTTFPDRKPLPDSMLLKDALYHIEITYTNSADTTALVFRTFALGNGTYQGDVEEWWGLDNILVTVSDEPLAALTECNPQVVQAIVQDTATQATLYVVGEAGTDMTVQSSVNLTDWVDEEVVNFIGFYKGTVSLQTTAPIAGQKAVLTPPDRMKLWRIIQTPKKK
jgi:hypothetical protein